LGGDDGKLLKI